MKTNADENVKKFGIWNPSNSDCECDKSYDIGESLDYKNCKCRCKLLCKYCSENIDGNKRIYNETVNVSSSDYKCGSLTL